MRKIVVSGRRCGYYDVKELKRWMELRGLEGGSVLLVVEEEPVEGVKDALREIGVELEIGKKKGDVRLEEVADRSIFQDPL